MRLKFALVVSGVLFALPAYAETLKIDNEVELSNTFERMKKQLAFQDSFTINEGLVNRDIGKGRNGKDEESECPPCFNCNLPNFECTQFSTCNAFTGMCECPEGFGGLDCSEPLCGSLSDGNSKRPIRDDASCTCKPGWEGINCNMCTEDSSCDAFMPEGLKGTCYKSGLIVNKFHQMCDVTNKKIISILNGKKPQVTFSCNKTANACNFQFWIDQKESFYCDLDKCALEYDLKSNTSHYKCENVACKCLPERMLCGEDGSIDISEFLTETIKGPGDFSCDVNKKDCQFSEPSMNGLISNVFGDPYITLHCKSGECVHKSEIPGYELPGNKKLTLNNIAVIASVGFVCVSIIISSIYNIGKSPLFKTGSGHIELVDEDEFNAMHDNFTPTTISFEKISYTIKENKVLNEVYGNVRPGECLAIMGGSGAGKTTLLDILAGKSKNGDISGSIYINGNTLNPNDFKKIVGFVDQEDQLISTLTVYETVLNSALLRLPKKMSFKAKETRVIEVLNELRILAIKDQVIGSDFQRGISGGEKRRVSIACELVTSPSILFLDEPTSGLDSYNARNVIDCLVKLSKDFKRTIIFTIHQPRSNIVSLFDKLILLSEGDLVYSGDMVKCNDYFTRHGYKCPLGYNIADYLIDITVDHKKIIKIKKSGGNSLLPDLENLSPETTDVHEEFVRTTNNTETDITREWEHLAVHRDEYNYDNLGKSGTTSDDETLVRIKNRLPDIYAESPIFLDLKQEIIDIKANPTKIELKNQYLQKPNIFSQFLILSSRTFKNLYRNPKLLLSHYVLSFIVGSFCGYLYYDVSNDISGFQNRLGLFFFILALFGFSSLTGLHSFSSERIIFIRERANNYYHPFSYYASKIMCDVLPLRVLPPVILLSIAYPLIGLTMDHNAFLKAILVLILFNIAVAVEVLIVGILIRDPGTSTMVGVLCLLLSLLFAGLFINSEDLRSQIRWLEWVSVFHYAYEALAINEVKDLILREKKYGLSIEVPGAVILSTFGFDVAAYWKDAFFLTELSAVFLVIGYVFLHYFTIEKR